MSILLLQTLDYLMYALHVVVIGINTFAWIFHKTRRIHLVIILATTFSWFVLGIWYGFGYCFLTDLEWDIKRQLGETSLPASFIHYAINTTLNMGINTRLLDVLTGLIFGIALVMALILNYRDFKLRGN